MTQTAPSPQKAPARKPRKRAAPVRVAKPYALEALKAATLGTVAALVLTFVALWFVGHAASWRSIATWLMQSLPMLPGFWLGFLFVGWLERRFNLPTLLTLALVVLGTLVVMLAAPGLAFTLYIRVFVGGADEFMYDYTFRQALWALASGFGLYLATGAWLWWPIGLGLPPIAAFLYWRHVRRH